MAQYVLVEKEKCMGPPCGEGEGLDSMCKTTEWSDWSPCSATCGKGVKIRTRFLLVDPELQMKCAARVEIIQQRPCEDTPNCNLSPEVAKGKPMSMIIIKNANSFFTAVCMLPNEPGPCQSYFPRWYFDTTTGTCVSFIFGGCRGNRNNFLTLDECQSACSVMTQSNPVQNRRTSQNSLQNGNKIDCMMTPWGDWSTCSVTCGVGFSERVRMIKVEAKNGGRPCPGRLSKLKRCIRPPCQ